ncbi:Serine/threonine-protein kinase, partial [Coemansia sp. RSA 2681]
MAGFDVTQQIGTLRGVYSLLSKAPHVLSHGRVFSDERAVYILRQYLHNNLYDRISTRPFLSGVEKRWIAYQLLVGLREAHGRGVCHGDIKAENVVVTSWNLAYLADFAPFKPTYLPADDPAEFNFYFDSSGRQCCCIAPERFYEAGSSIAAQLTAAAAGPAKGGQQQQQQQQLALQASMDIFSLGCVIAELFLDGNPVFSLSRLLQYRSGGGVAASALVGGIGDAEIAGLVQHMLQLDPSARLSAGEYLDRWGAVFPQAPLAAYMDTAGADARVRALHAEGTSCAITAAVACASVRNCRLGSVRSLGIDVLLRCARAEAEAEAEAEAQRSGGQGQRQGQGKGQGKGQGQGPSLGMDVVLPYLVALGGDASARVRGSAVVAVRALLAAQRRLAASNARVFDDYVAAQLQYFAADASVGVRCLVAAVLGDIADAAHALGAGGAGGGVVGAGGGGVVGALGADDAGGGAFGAQARAVVARLSFDAAAEVRHVLLCAFPALYARGLQSLAHIITYLNDRDCWFLRAAFFDVVFAAAAQISSHAAREYVVPLLNLRDQEVFVVASALRALQRLVPQLSPAMLWDKLVEVQAACGRRHGPLRAAAAELTSQAVASARLPMAPDVAMVALAMSARPEENEPPTQTHTQTLSIDRVVRLRDIGAPLRTVFLTAAESRGGEGGGDGGGGEGGGDGGGDGEGEREGDGEALKRFLRKQAQNQQHQQSQQQIAYAYAAESMGSSPLSLRLAGEVCEHTEAVTCLAAAGRGGVFVAGGADGAVRAFDGAAARRSATLRAVGVHALGGRVTGLAYSAALDCVAAVAACGRVHMLRASRSGLQCVAATRLARGEHGVAVAFVSGARVAVATSRSRVLFLDAAARLAPIDAVALAPALGRPTSVAADAAAWGFVVVGTAAGACVVVDARFCVVVRAYYAAAAAAAAAAAVTALAPFGADRVLVATAAGDVSVLGLRDGRRAVCVGARPLHELKAAAPSRRLRVNGLARLPQAGASAVLAASNDALLRLWDLDRLERSHVGDRSRSRSRSSRSSSCVNASSASAAAAADSNAPGAAPSASPISAVAVLTSPVTMVVCGHQNGAIRLLV